MDLSRNLWFFLEINLHNNHSNINRLLVNASLSKQIATTNQTHFIIKSIFWVIHFMVITNWGYTQNFEGVIELIRNCGGNELKTLFLSSPKNTLYISPVYISKYIGVIDDYLTLPLLVSLREKHLTSITDETTNITFIEQVVLYATFEHNNETKEDFVVINPISKVHT